MCFAFRPRQLFTLAAVGPAEQDYQRAVEYLMAENHILKAKLGKKRILLTDDERRVLAVKGKSLGRRALEQVASIVTPDAILRWHRELIAAKWNHAEKRKAPGRSKIAAELEELVLRLAKENPSWGYDRIAGALDNLGHELSDTTVGNILKAHGIEPAPELKKMTNWKTFIKSHWDVLAAVDFTTVEVWTTRGLVTFYLLFVMELATRRVRFAGCTVNPNAHWMKQAAHELTAFDDGFLNGKKHLLMDRDTKFTVEFHSILERERVESVLLPPKSPNLNANLERFFRSLKDECLSRMIFFGEQTLRNATVQFVEHSHTERNHQGLENKLIEPGAEVGQATGEVECRQRLGGLLNYYYRHAA